MDFPHLVHPLNRLLRAPALHYAVLGGVLFTAWTWRESAPASERLVIPAFRVEAAFRDYEILNERPLTPQEKRIIVDYVTDQETLHAYARRLGLDKEPVVERRLAQIARFVAENPHEPKSLREQADEAVLLGLDEDDMVVRRVLIDGAKRLIRAAALVREPPDAALEAYLKEHSDQFRLPGRIRLSHVAVDALRHRERTERDAIEFLARLRGQAVPPEAAGRYGDRGFVESNLPSLTERELGRRFGHRFVERLSGLPVGSWEGPISSRYGLHLVFIEERLPERIPGLDEARNEVRARVREQLADEWLALRLKQLRAEFAVEIVGNAGQQNY